MKLLPLIALLPLVLAASAAPFDTQGYDRQVRPQDDLFRAVNGGWLKTTEIAADRSDAFGADLPAIASERVRALLSELAAKPQPAGSLAQKAGAYYASIVDTAAIDAAGLAPVQALLADIDAIGDRAALARWQGAMQGSLATPVWLWGGFADFKDPGVSRALAWQGGLGMPDRSYYLNDGDARIGAVRAAYQRYLAALAALAGMPQPEQAAQQVLALERRIALAHVGQDEARDPGKMYHPLTAAQLNQAAPGFDWPAFLHAAGMADGATVTVAQLPAAVAIARLYDEVALDQWRQYAKLHVLMEAAPVLPQAFRDAHFAFNGKALAGAAAPEPRWQSAIDQLNAGLGDAVGHLYVARYFPAADRARVQRMFEQVRAAYGAAIAHGSWMSAPTRAQALAKLERMQAKIGYPERWTDYGALDIRAGDALGNRRRAQRFEWLRKAAQSGGPVDRGAWMMAPQTVNAYYDPSLNEIVLPAGILQAPLFDPKADDAANYGAIGAMIGHELSHGFDTMGKQFDGAGVMRDWWSGADQAAFDALGARLSAQFDAYQPLPGRHVDGRLTLPENLADLAGLEVALQAYRRSLGGKPAPVIGGYSGEQRFFLSYARSQRIKLRAERQAALLASDPHAPGEFRVNGAAVNVDGFHRAFGTRPGDVMYKAVSERLRIW
ncbi:peptidase M13 [Duganella rhizosphaerae]|uniref:M13 family metallopeptidase n=1 Tax=Duganella rhizosphaerae TaxID=2885763 RepID=UPI0030EAC120